MTEAEPIYFGGKDGSLFGWYHSPRNNQNRGAGVVLCNTLGNESLRVHRSLRHEALRLSEQGFAVLRFDFYSTGDSLGSDSSGDLVARWLQDIQFAVLKLKEKSGFEQIALFGIRLGATLAAKAACELEEVQNLVLWEPFSSGKDFVKESSRQHKMLLALSPSTFTLDREGGAEGGREFLGFFVNDATLRSLDSLDLNQIEKSPATNILVIGSSASPGGFQKTIDHFNSQVKPQASPVEYLQIPGYQGIFREALFSEVPFQVLDETVAWFAEKYPNSAEPFLIPQSHEQTVLVQSTFHETPLFFGKAKKLFGVLTSPSTAAPGKNKKVVIIANAGVGTHIGPHRLYVQMARGWAALGYSVFRTDLAWKWGKPRE